MEVSASILIQYHQAVWKPQNFPNASSTQRKNPPSSGTALDSSVATSACDRPQKTRPTRSIRTAAPGPASRTIASSPNGPDETNTKMVPARVRTPSPRRSPCREEVVTRRRAYQRKEALAGLFDLRFAMGPVRGSPVRALLWAGGRERCQTEGVVQTPTKGGPG